jgi:hypothetical protein
MPASKLIRQSTQMLNGTSFVNAGLGALTPESCKKLKQKRMKIKNSFNFEMVH